MLSVAVFRCELGFCLTWMPVTSILMFRSQPVVAPAVPRFSLQLCQSPGIGKVSDGPRVLRAALGQKGCPLPRPVFRYAHVSDGSDLGSVLENTGRLWLFFPAVRAPSNVANSAGCGGLAK